MEKAMKTTVKDKTIELQECNYAIDEIYSALVISEEVKDKIAAMKSIEFLPEIISDNSLYNLNGYKEMRGNLKRLYIKVAETIMEILNSNKVFCDEKENSFVDEDYTVVIEAAKCVKLLPNAFIGGPMKAAIGCQNADVLKFVSTYYRTLPTDLKVSEVFPPDFRNKVRQVNMQLNASA